MKLFSGQFLLWHISPGHGFQLGAVVTRLTSAEGPGGNHPCWGSQGAFPAWMKGRQVEAGETLIKNPQGTQALRRSELWHLGGAPQTRAVFWATSPLLGAALHGAPCRRGLGLG